MKELCPKCGSPAMPNGYVYCRSKYAINIPRKRRYKCPQCGKTFYGRKVRDGMVEKKLRRSVRMKVKEYEWEHWSNELQAVVS